MTPSFPLRRASAIANGICDSASTTFARIRCTSANISCSCATARERRSSALACAIFLSASACSACNFAPIFLPTSTSAISMDRISYAVPASNPFLKIVWEIESGFSKTNLW